MGIGARIPSRASMTDLEGAVAAPGCGEPVSSAVGEEDIAML